MVIPTLTAIKTHWEILMHLDLMKAIQKPRARDWHSD